MKFKFIKKPLLITLWLLVVSSIGFLILTIMYLNGFMEVFSIILMTCVVAGLGYELIFGIFSHTFFINEQGVKYKKHKKTYSLSWDQINFIGIASPQGSYNKNCPIYFDARTSDYLTSITNIKYMKDYNELFFGVQYRKKIVKEIRKYWDKPIYGIYQVEGYQGNR